MTLPAHITEDEFNAQKETFEPTGVEIFLSQKPCGEDFLFFLLPFRFYLTLFTLNFFLILDVLPLTKHRPIIVNQSAHSLPKLFPSHIIILSHIEISNP